MFSEKSKLQMNTVQYVLTKFKNTHRLLHTVCKCLCRKCTKRCIGTINTKLRTSRSNRVGERDRNAPGTGTQGASMKMMMCYFLKAKQSKTKQKPEAISKILRSD